MAFNFCSFLLVIISVEVRFRKKGRILNTKGKINYETCHIKVGNKCRVSGLVHHKRNVIKFLYLHKGDSLIKVSWFQSNFLPICVKVGKKMGTQIKNIHSFLSINAYQKMTQKIK